MSVVSPFLVTPGEPAGIGTEITIKSWKSGIRDICLIESPSQVAKIANSLGEKISIEEIIHPEQFQIDHDALQILSIDWPVTPIAGLPDSRNGKMVIDTISTAVKFCQSGAAAGIITNPIQKSTLYER